MRLPLLLLAFVVLSPPVQAQDEELTRPPDWMLRFDRPAPDSAIYFVDMPPGWHITTGPAAILYDPAMAASTNTGRPRGEPAAGAAPRRLRHTR